MGEKQIFSQQRLPNHAARQRDVALIEQHEKGKTNGNVQPNAVVGVRM
ncbi:MAG: hypothetical protein ABSF63_06450 [Candidatus Bathyarchaeia archaeon]